MKNIIFIITLLTLFIACDKNPIQPINPTNPQTISHDSILYNINNGVYYRTDPTYDRGVKGVVHLTPNSMRIDSVSSPDSISCYARFNVTINYNYCQQQLLSDLANNPSLSIAYVDTPTHVIFDSYNCRVSGFYTGTHLQKLHGYIAKPVVGLKFISNDGRMEGSNDVEIRIGDICKNCWQLTTDALTWGTRKYNALSQETQNMDFVISAVNTKRGVYHAAGLWDKSF